MGSRHSARARPGPAVRATAASLTVSMVAALVLVGLGADVAGSQATKTPPPTPVPPSGSPSPFPSTLRTPTPSTSEPPAIEARAAVLADLDTGQILFGQRGTERRPIASVTKIMTALVVLERASPEDVVTVSEEVAPSPTSYGLSELKLLSGERITVRDLLYALLLQSANDAALALAEHVGGSVEGFVRLMNRRARALGLTGTRFFSPSGLDDRGTSTARDLVAITREAYRFPLFADLVATRFHDVPAPNGAEPRRIQNRNVLLWLYPGAVGVKTGFTTAAGFCVVAVAEREGRRLLAIVLGATGEPFSEAAALLDHGFVAFEERTLVERGEAAGTVALPGGTVSVEAVRSLELLVPATAGEPTRSVRPYPGAAFPPALGEAVADLVVSSATRELGRVPLVAADVPPPPEPEGAAWWSRAAGSFAAAVADAAAALFGG